MATPGKKRQFLSREYKIFREEERESSLPRSIYEKLCISAEKIMKVQPDKKTEKTLQEAINFAHLKVTPTQVSSLTMLFAFAIVFPTFVLIALKLLFGLPGLTLGSGLIVMVLTLPFVYYLYIYPLHIKKLYEMDAGSEIVTLILYMAMYMRNMPNLEGAVKFSAENMSGQLSYEIRKMLWDVEVGNYVNMQDALFEYAKKWQKNREFVEAVELLVASLHQIGPSRERMLNEAVEVILKGSREQARHFNQDLKMPVMVVHAMGIILPVLGLVLFPIVAVFLGVDASLLFIGYDILLPIVLFFVISNILEKRPATFSKIDISENPNIPPKGKFRLGRRVLSAFPIAFVVGGSIIALGFLYHQIDKEGLIAGAIIVGGIAAGLGLYFLMLSSQRMQVRDKTRKIETEFAEALFQLGSSISTGIPVELSVERSLKRVGNLAIKDLFARALNNMKTMGMTFSEAFFNKDYGAIRFYPSRLIKSVMRTVVEASKKGVETTSQAMLSVSQYLKGLHDTQEEVQESLSETVNSLKFQAYFLSPLISGVIVTMAIIIIRILGQLSTRLANSSFTDFPLVTQFGAISITPFQFVVVVGVYLVETALILGFFINGIENGEDPLGKQNTMGKSVLIGYIVFMIALFVTLLIFTPLIVATF